MAGEGRRVSLGEVIDLLTGFPFKSTQFSHAPENIRLLRGDNVAQGRTRWEGVKRWPVDDRGEFQDYELRLGDVVLAMDRPWIEAGLKYAMIKNADCPSLLVQRVARLRALPGMDQRYLGYVIGSADFTNYVLGVQTGTAVPHISGSQIKSYEFTLPPIQQQVATAELLSALDGKIELNRQVNETLAAMARAIFKCWFVDFDPVRAKIEGRKPYLSQDIWSLFPDHLGDGGSPSGWSEKPLTHFFEIVGGGTPKTSEASYWGGDIPWFSVVDTPSDANTYVIDTQKTITAEGLQDSSAQLIEAGATIVSARGTVGNLARTGRPMAFNQSCYGLRGANGYGPSFVFLTASHMVSKLQSLAHGSVFSTITRQTFEAISLFAPGSELADQFEMVSGPLFDRILTNVQESHTLSVIRNLLLPKLVSGEVRIKDAEKLIGKTGA
jgi:type I restriction enzyme S subunit